MLSTTIRRYLDEHKAHYELIPHTPAYTASQTAQAAHVSGEQLAKTIVVKVDGKLALVVLPAHHRVDLDTLRATSHAEHVEVASEFEFQDRFANCELGAMPPFGDLYHLPVYLAPSLKRQEWVAFNCGTHAELVRMDTDEFIKLIHPKLLVKF